MAIYEMLMDVVGVILFTTAPFLVAAALYLKWFPGM